MKSVIHNINILILVRAHFRNVHSSTSSLPLAKFELSANSQPLKRNSLISANEMNWNQSYEISFSKYYHSGIGQKTNSKLFTAALPVSYSLNSTF